MILVTGITGHTGRHFHDILVECGFRGKLRCVVRKESKIGFLEQSPLDVELLEGDLSDQGFLDKAGVGVSELLHIAGIRHSPNVMRAAIRNEIHSLIFVHTTGIYSRYRQASEEYQWIEEGLSKDLQSHPGLCLTILRPTMIFGDLSDRNMSRFIGMMDRWRIFPVINGGRGLIQPVNARDLANAYLAVLELAPEKRKQGYILSGERVMSMLEMLEMILKELNKRTLFLSFPAWMGVGIVRCLKCLSLGRVDLVEKVQRMTEDRCFPYEDAKNDFGYKPEPFQEGLAREVAAYLESAGRTVGK